MIEALACGMPVAAYPVTGPVDVLTPRSGAMDEDLDAAIAAALTRDRAACAAYGARLHLEASAAPVPRRAGAAIGDALRPDASARRPEACATQIACPRAASH